MNSADVRRLALVLSVQAEIEAMKAENTWRISRDESIAYTERPFIEAAERLRNIACSHDDQL